MTKKKVYKIVAVYLALSMFFEIVSPTVALALTGGPSQPEVESFEPVGTTQMVDLFSGDYNYNLPLLNIPGPNGGYPVNLAYHAGIGMEQEASWVGLGWNINPGVINRQVRGLPDDFDGDQVTKQVSMRPNNTFGLGMQVPISGFEVMGLKTGAFSYQMYYNNYKGIGQMIGLNLSSLEQNHCSTGFGWSLNVSYDSNGGLGVDPSMSYSKIRHDTKMNSYHLGLGFHSRQGLTGINLSHERRNVTKSTEKQADGTDKTVYRAANEKPKGAGGSFSFSTYVPHAESMQHGFNARLTLETGTALLPLTKFPVGTSLYGSMSMLETNNDAVNYPAYGYLHTEDRTSAVPNGMMDFNREKDTPPTKNTPSMAVPVYTNDIYMVKGQGVGGVFRPYRSDMGILTDPTVQYDIPGGSITVEEATSGANWHLGLDLGLNYSSTYTGDWKGEDTEISSIYAAQGKPTSASSSLYEPAFFRASGEHDKCTNVALLNEDPARFNMDLTFSNTSLKPIVRNVLVDTYNGNTASPTSVGTVKGVREKRTQSLEYMTNDEINQLGEYPYNQMTLYKPNLTTSVYPTPVASSAYDYTHADFVSSSQPGKHLGQLSVLNPDGNRYVYGIAAYNRSMKEVCFSVDPTSSDNMDPSPPTPTYVSCSSDTKQILYKSTGSTPDNGIKNTKGLSHYYESTNTPAFAHSYMLTSVLSPDYVDLKNDGPTPDDFGSYTKFNYSVQKNYNWRIPFNANEANYIKGKISDLNDDKATYTWGVKDLYYLNSIETKTHIAIFILNDSVSDPRHDAYGVSGENGGAGASQRYLKQIKLYSKSDIAANGSTAVPIKTINFEYNYALCGSVDNNDNASDVVGGVDLNQNHGKLTLQRVWFAYEGNTKGQLSPYVFNYNETNTGLNQDNPNYSKSQEDRWGNYKPDDLTNSILNIDNPYCDQRGANKSNIDNNAAAWSLKNIILPSGGTMAINYESDDYAYVQDQKAMQMCHVVGTYGDNSFGGLSSSIDGSNLWVYFDIDQQIPTSAMSSGQLITNLTAGIDDDHPMYFKMFEKLKRYYPLNAKACGGAFAYDYVEGYAQIDKQAGNWYATTSSGGYYTRACIKVKQVNAENTNTGFHTSPFRKAGWQYLKMQRPELFVPSNDPTSSGINALPPVGILGILANAVQMISGFYNYCYMMNFCSDMITPGGSWDFYKPSYIRLYTPNGKKNGGGHRVKSITISDAWNIMTASHESGTSYGQQFSYVMPDGTSSGVAEYEPLIGGEEIPQHLPDKYSTDNLFFNDNALFITKPYGESYFPSAGVGYSRVIVKNIDNAGQGPTNTKEGITVSEFYTAKDFPVFVDKTDLVQKKYRLPILIPFIGMQSFNNMGFTQGYLVELNDMHGKAKSVATYSANANLNDGLQLPITKVEYFYNTKNAYTPNGPNYLNSQVTVLDANATTSTAEIGKNVEFFVDKREHSNTTSALTLQGNLDASVFICTLTAIPNFEWSEAMFRSVVTNKVVTKNGILMETHAYDQGSMVVTKNLMFDSETGTPLLTTVTNDYNNPVYTYNYSAQWAYDNMGGAYKNYRAQINVLNSSGINSVTSATTYLTVGDELSYVNGFSTLQRLWVKSINPSTNVVVFMDETGSTVTLANNTSLTVLRSGRRNMQSVQNGVIVSLYNPLNIFAAGSGPFTTLFAALTTAAQTITSFGCQVNTFSYTNPCTGQTSTLTISFTTTDGDTRLNITDGSCTAYIDFHDHTVNCATIDGSTLTISGSDVTLSRTGYSPIGGTWVDTDNCWAANCNTVLHASATRYNDNWTMNYADAQSPQVLYLGHSTTSDVGSEVAGTGNLYRLGQRGIWRQESNYLYQIDRIRSNPTNISWDGMYNKFVPYDWTVLQAAEDLPWTLTSRVSQYSPYGFELENKDTLGIYSSALYGYTNTLPAAVVKNSHNMEMAFDGFEDYPAGNPYPAVQLINGVLTPYTIGHIPFTVSSTSDVFIGNIGHSGNYGLVVNNGNDAYYTVTVPTGAYVNSSYPAFTPQAGQDYNLSVWVINTSASHKEVGDAKVTVYNGSSPIATYITSPSDIIVEGWHKIDLKFTAPASGSALKIDLTCTGGSLEQAVFDDFRLQPFTSSMKSYVYDPITLWLKAELDDRNFATFYNYDELGALVQVKKETEKGVVTIKSSRNNTHH